MFVDSFVSFSLFLSKLQERSSSSEIFFKWVPWFSFVFLISCHVTSYYSGGWYMNRHEYRFPLNLYSCLLLSFWTASSVHPSILCMSQGILHEGVSKWLQMLMQSANAKCFKNYSKFFKKSDMHLRSIILSS